MPSALNRKIEVSLPPMAAMLSSCLVDLLELAALVSLDVLAEPEDLFFRVALLLYPVGSHKSTVSEKQP